MFVLVHALHVVLFYYDMLLFDHCTISRIRRRIQLTKTESVSNAKEDETCEETLVIFHMQRTSYAECMRKKYTR